MEFTREQLGAIAYNAVDDDNNAWVSQTESGCHFGFMVSDLADFALAQLDRAKVIEQRLRDAEEDLDTLEIEVKATYARAESAEAERDILQWASDHAGGGGECSNRKPMELWPWPSNPPIQQPGTVPDIEEEKARYFAGEDEASWSVNTHLNDERVVSEIRLTVPGFADDELRRRVLAAVRKPDPIRLAESAYRETEAELREAGERIISEGSEPDCGCDCGIVRIPESPERPHEALVWAQFFAAQIPRSFDGAEFHYITEAMVENADNLLEIWRARWPEPKA